MKGANLTNPVRPVEWGPRSFNKIADSVANQVMDNQIDIDWQCCVRSSWFDKKLLVVSDGGVRSKHALASAAWVVIELIKEEGELLVA